jgi:hypothetical protein
MQVTIRTLVQSQKDMRNFYDLAQQVNDAADDNSDIAYLIERMVTLYDELDQALTDASVLASDLQEQAETAEIKLEDIFTTFDMVSTGYRDFTDLARTIQA